MTAPRKEYTKPASWLRRLDMDDLYLLKLSHEGLRCADIAKALGLSFPAISQRVKKITASLETPIFKKSGNNLILTPSGKEAAFRASAVIDSLCVMVGQLEKEVIPERPKKAKKVIEIEAEEEEAAKVDCGYLGSGG